MMIRMMMPMMMMIRMMMIRIRMMMMMMIMMTLMIPIVLLTIIISHGWLLLRSAAKLKIKKLKTKNFTKNFLTHTTQSHASINNM